jgi:hypothetical protein
MDSLTITARCAFNRAQMLIIGPGMCRWKCRRASSISTTPMACSKWRLSILPDSVKPMTVDSSRRLRLRRRMGVCPVGPRWCLSWRDTKSRSHRRRRFLRLGGEPFFEAGPIMGQPGLDQGVITLPRLDRRVLRTPAEGCESAGQIMGMVPNATCDQDQGANPVERPTLRSKACRQCSPAQHLQQVLPLVCGQAGRTSRHRSVLQTSQITPAVPELLGPGTDSRAADTELACNGRVGQRASLQQPTSVQAAFFQWRSGEMSWSPDHGHAL